MRVNRACKILIIAGDQPPLLSKEKVTECCISVSPPNLLYWKTTMENDGSVMQELCFFAALHQSLDFRTAQPNQP